MKIPPDAGAPSGETRKLARSEGVEERWIGAEPLMGPGRAGGNWKAQKHGFVIGALSQDEQGIAVVFEGIVPVGGEGDLPLGKGSWVRFNKAEVPAGGVTKLTLAAMEMTAEELDANGDRSGKEGWSVGSAFLRFMGKKYDWWSCGGGSGEDGRIVGGVERTVGSGDG
jgi:hypothetical protein